MRDAFRESVQGVLERVRGLERSSPSALEGGARIKGTSALALRRSMGFNIGTLVHAWFEQIEWLEDGVPSDNELRKIAERLRSDTGDLTPQLGSLISRFRQSLAAERIANVLSRSYYSSPNSLGLAHLEQWPAGRLELAALRERPFAIRSGDELLTGSIDRLVVIQSAGRPVAADIIDFKTDELPADHDDLLWAKLDYYRPQIEAYRAAAATFLGLESTRISARLVFLSIGAVCQLERPGEQR